MIASKSFIIYEGPHYAIRLEYTEGIFIIHFEHLNKFSKSILKDMLERFRNFYEFCVTVGRPILFAGIDPKNTKVRRIAERCGFKHIANNQGWAIYSYEGVN